MSLSKRENKGERTEERKKGKKGERTNRHGGNSKKMLCGNVQKPPQKIGMDNLILNLPK